MNTPSRTPQPSSRTDAHPLVVHAMALLFVTVLLAAAVGLRLHLVQMYLA